MTDTVGDENHALDAKKAKSKILPFVFHRSALRGANLKKRKALSAADATPKPEFKEATLLEVCRYADFKDWALIIVGVLASFATGAAITLSTCIFRGISDALMKAEGQLKANGTIVGDEFKNNIIYYVKFYFILGVVEIFIMFLSMGCMFTACERQVDKIRDKFFRAVLGQDAAWFDRNQVGALTQKMTSGIEQIKHGLSDKLAIIIQAIGASSTGVIVAFSFNWQMTLASLCTAPFILLSVYASRRAIFDSLRGEMSAYASAGGVADEVLGGIRTVHAFNAQNFETQRYEKYLQIGRKMGIKKATRIAFFSALYMTIFFCSAGLMFWFGTYLAYEKIITPGTVFSIFWLIFVGALRLGEAMPQLNVIVSAKLAAGEIFSIIDRQPSPDSRALSGIRPKKVLGRIEFCNVHFTYPTRPTVAVLNGVSFTVDAGESVALVGHSGCGKSTIVSLLLRYYNYSHGAITMDGLPLYDLNVKWLRNTIGIVSQESVLFAATVEDNLRMGNPDATMDEMITACTMANAHEFISKLEKGYQTLVGDGGVKLSGGEKQRLSIARALVRQPKILLLDEATSALDAENESIVQRALEQASAGRTTITIAHRLSTIRNANKIIVFERGEIVEAGTHDELLELKGGVYRQLVVAQEITRHSPDDDFETEMSADEAEKEVHLKRRASRESERMARLSSRIRQSLVSLKNVEDFQNDNAIAELEEEGARAATTLEILRFAQPERMLTMFGVILSIIMGASMPVFSLLYGQTFLTMTSAYNESSSNSTSKMSAASITGRSALNTLTFVLVGIVVGFTSFGSSALLAVVGERMTMRLRSMVFKNLLRQDGAYFDDNRHTVGKLTMRLANDAPNVQAAIDQRLSGALQGIVALLTAVAVALYISWNVAPVGLSVALILLFLQACVSGYLERRGARDADVADNASKIATESIEYVRTVQALTRENFQHAAFREASRIPHRLAVIRAWWQSVGYALSFSFMAFNFGVVYLVGMYMIQANYTTPYSVFQVVEVLNMAAFTIMRTASYFPEFVRGKLSAGLMFSMAAQTPKIDADSNSGLFTPINGSIEANGAYFAYPNASQKLVLRGLSLNAPHGKTVALVGPSGCGKSTIIQLLERFYDVLGGSISIDGTDVRQFNIRHLRGTMALVGQEPTLFNLSVRENVAYGLDTSAITDEQIVDATKRANIHAFIESLPEKYETKVGAKGTQLSGGQKQRIAIARAIIRNPKILLLDEATSALDTESEKVVQEALDRARHGRTCIIIAHRLSTIQNADLIVVVRDGRVYEMGTHQQLLSRRGLYYRLVERQSE